MADRFYGGARPGVTSTSIFVRLARLLDNTDATGLLFSDIDAAYVRSGGLSVDIAPVSLATPDAAWASGGFVEVHATRHPGLYRLDVPDAAWVSGADEVCVTVSGVGLFSFHRAYPLETRRSLRRGVAFPGYMFVMRQSAAPGLGATGLTVTAQKAFGGAFSAMTGPVVEVSNGAYVIDLSASDVAGSGSNNLVTFRFSAPGALDAFVSHILEPAGG